ncbi:MAG TPA: ABC transporter ATP-binding protein, partial [Methylomirabilota bacterium]|nr:ABC transporter ATP-binding protein [Methylomirabilota bacterium]
MRDDAEHDEIVGRAFDRRLMARLWRAVGPHRTLVLGGSALFPLIAAVELAQPWLLKVAIDDYILRADWPGLGLVAAAYAATLVVL